MDSPAGHDVPHVVGVVTIAGNLDPDAWIRLHDYLPLTGSLNPALAPLLPKSLREWHLIGERDTNVPYSAAQEYLHRVPPDRIWRYASFDHACCWVREWPAAFARSWMMEKSTDHAGESSPGGTGFSRAGAGARRYTARLFPPGLIHVVQESLPL